MSKAFIYLCFSLASLGMFAGCAAFVKKDSPIIAYSADISIKILACDFQIKCLDGLCMAKLICPPGIEHNPK